MKIITWNCNMAFRKKAAHILAYKPDILVVPECEHPDKLKFADDVQKPTDILWFGENKNKGLGIFSYSYFKFKLIKTHNPAFKMIVPIAVTGNDFKFTLFAVWANNPADPDGVYVEQVWKALQHYKLSKKKTILTGDFNCAAGDELIAYLQAPIDGGAAAYCDAWTLLRPGERHPSTVGVHDKKQWEGREMCFDFIFVSSDLAPRARAITVESATAASDHQPLLLELDP